MPVYMHTSLNVYFHCMFVHYKMSMIKSGFIAFPYMELQEYKM